MERIERIEVAAGLFLDPRADEIEPARIVQIEHDAQLAAVQVPGEPASPIAEIAAFRTLC